VFRHRCFRLKQLVIAAALAIMTRRNRCRRYGINPATGAIKPGYKVPVDGIVIDGHSSGTNHAERRIRAGKQSVGEVSARTVNTDSALLVSALNQQNTTLAKIIRLVEEAQSSKAPIQRLADTIVPWFVLVTLICATVTFFIWNSHDFEIALMAATSVLIITCPCALGMATPMSIAVASGLGAKHGILIRAGLLKPCPE
jgi:Cu2+-exporting ATPase